MKGNERILIVEDEPGIQETLKISLELDGYLPIIAATAKECLDFLDEHIHLIILDIGLPDQNGFELLKNIRKTSKIPIILLTARNSETDKVVGLELEADDYVVKPFSPRELMARIRAVLRRSSNFTTENSSIFQIDENKKIILYRGKSLPLSPYEYKTLLLFIKRQGTIFTREEIMDLVWTTPEDSFDRAVDTVIKNIRSRLKEIDPNSDPIETRRGIGYGLKNDI
ncbi:response regulator [Leptospira sp. GIMC2001]|uniref:response regulator n=1 Tax=Leptospira sp. GIMC2001 TaxID=1513297 RepID=UPI002349273F|nr:response regulator [Leptospira sp. GIMC2001]WCL48689.1 response regulator [Leptospira sp. GIMC2001]